MTCSFAFRRTLRVVVGALALAFGAHALAAPGNDRPSFRRLSSSDGLPPAVVYSMAQDARGFLWFGTAGGLARFDGYEFRVFQPDPANPRSIADSGVLAIAATSDGDLWLATDGGLDRWNHDVEQFTHFRHDPAAPGSLTDNTVQALESDPDGSLWVGTGRGGLNRLDVRTGRFEPVPLPLTASRAARPWIRCLERDRSGQLWVGTADHGLFRVEIATGRIDRFTASDNDANGLPSDEIHAVAADATGTVWIGTEGGLCRFNPERQRIERPVLALADGEDKANTPVLAVLPDRDGIVWVGTAGSGLLRHNPRTGRTIRARHSVYATDSLAADTVRSLFEDRAGDIWVGHFPEGVSHIDRLAAAFQRFAHVPEELNSLSDSHVLSFAEDRSGDLWVGTDAGGLNHWSAETGAWRNYVHAPNDPTSLGGRAAVCVLRDSSGDLWVGTWDGGLNRLPPGSHQFQRYVASPGVPEALQSNRIWTLAEDHDRQLWIGTIGGGVSVYQREHGTFVTFQHRDGDARSLPDDIVSSVLVAKDGSVWVGTPKGLARIDRATRDWAHHPHSTDGGGPATDYWIFDMAQAEDGSLWYTTEGGGLNHFDPRSGRRENFRTAEGLPSDITRSILIDRRGVLWVGTNHGLTRFDPVTRRVRVYGESDGLPGGLFTPHGRLELASGDLLFGTTRGFVRFDPYTLGADWQPPPVVVTSLEIFGRRVLPAATGSPLQHSITEIDRLKLPDRASVLSLQFAALTYRSTERTRYRFRLDGFDTAWRVPGPERRATFTNLDPGTYRFRVKAANADGVWNETGASLTLVIVPAWWRAWWFKAGLLLLFAAIAAGIGWVVSAHRAREAQHRRELEVERERTREREIAAAAVQRINTELEERVAQRTEQLTNALKELEAFSYSVSHDLRSPLRIVDGFSRALLIDYAGKLDPEGEQNLRSIRTAAQRMGQLIDDLIDLARVTQTELHPVRVNLSQLAVTVADNLKVAHPQRQLEFAIEPDLWASADARFLRIVLENLFNNASKFTARQPVARIEFGRTLRNGAPAFYVRDNGVGFDPQYAAKLFKAFKRLHSPSEFPGSGIGLATVERIIRRHGGTVAAEGVAGQGATFYFTLPEPRDAGAQPAT